MKGSGPRPVFIGDREIDPPIVRRLRRARKLALFLDYDGTLTPIAATREAALPGASTMKVLRALVRSRNVRVAIVTGRSLSHVPRSIRTCGADLAADHGVRIVSRRGIWTHPALENLQPAIRQVYAALQERLRLIPGIRIERKRWSVDIHFRQVHLRHVPAIRTCVRSVMRSSGGALRLTQGKKVLEARPAIPWSKGHAILKLLATREYAGAVPVFIGDDRTDEDGFRALGDRGITVHVGTSRRTAARYMVRGVPEVLSFLTWISTGRMRRVGARPR